MGRVGGSRLSMVSGIPAIRVVETWRRATRGVGWAADVKRETGRGAERRTLEERDWKSCLYFQSRSPMFGLIRRVYQSEPSGLPSLGMQAFTHVTTDIPWLTPRTLPSPRATIMLEVCPPWVTYQLHCWADGPAWKPREP